MCAPSNSFNVRICVVWWSFCVDWNGYFFSSFFSRWLFVCIWWPLLPLCGLFFCSSCDFIIKSMFKREKNRYRLFIDSYANIAIRLSYMSLWIIHRACFSLIRQNWSFNISTKANSDKNAFEMNKFDLWQYSMVISQYSISINPVFVLFRSPANELNGGEKANV